jgi:hypothetical protein
VLPPLCLSFSSVGSFANGNFERKNFEFLFSSFVLFFGQKGLLYAGSWIGKFEYEMRFLPGGVVPIRFSTVGEAS